MARPDSLLWLVRKDVLRTIPDASIGTELGRLTGQRAATESTGGAAISPAARFGQYNRRADPNVRDSVRPRIIEYRCHGERRAACKRIAESVSGVARLKSDTRSKHSLSHLSRTFDAGNSEGGCAGRRTTGRPIRRYSRLRKYSLHLGILCRVPSVGVRCSTDTGSSWAVSR
jgi:hypothetical protein